MPDRLERSGFCVLPPDRGETVTVRLSPCGFRVSGVIYFYSRATMEEQERLYQDRQNERNQNP